MMMAAKDVVGAILLPYIFSLGNYDRFEHQDYERIYEYLSLIVRVEKEIDGQSYTIWIKEDGEI